MEPDGGRFFTGKESHDGTLDEEHGADCIACDGGAFFVTTTGGEGAVSVGDVLIKTSAGGRVSAEACGLDGKKIPQLYRLEAQG